MCETIVSNEMSSKMENPFFLYDWANKRLFYFVVKFFLVGHTERTSEKYTMKGLLTYVDETSRNCEQWILGEVLARHFTLTRSPSSDLHFIPFFFGVLTQSRGLMFVVFFREARNCVPRNRLWKKHSTFSMQSSLVSGVEYHERERERERDHTSLFLCCIQMVSENRRSAHMVENFDQLKFPQSGEKGKSNSRETETFSLAKYFATLGNALSYDNGFSWVTIHFRWL